MFTAETASALVAVVCGLCACQDQPLNRSPRSGYLGVHGDFATRFAKTTLCTMQAAKRAVRRCILCAIHVVHDTCMYAITCAMFVHKA